MGAVLLEGEGGVIFYRPIFPCSFGFAAVYMQTASLPLYCHQAKIVWLLRLNREFMHIFVPG
jgi:hypothetical protein